MSPETHWSGQVAELTPLVMATLGTHVVQLYDDDDFLLRTVARVAAEGLAAGDAVVVIPTVAHGPGLAAALRDRGIDVESMCNAERLTILDAHATLASFMDGDLPDVARFAATIGRVLDRAANATVRGRVRAFGEMVALLWSEGRRDAALAVESLWNDEINRRRTLSLLCAYPLAVFGGSDDTPRFNAMCERHTHVAPAESYGSLDSAGERLRAIAELQQKALVLETEHARATGARLTVTCKRCQRVVLTTSRIGNGEADAIALHLRDEHAGVLPIGTATLGTILREVVVEDLAH